MLTTRQIHLKKSDRSSIIYTSTFALRGEERAAIYFVDAATKNKFLRWIEIAETKLRLGWLGAMCSSLDRYPDHKKNHAMKALKRFTRSGP